MGDTSTAAEVEGLQWLDDDRRPLDWNGPTERPFTPFAAEDIERPVSALVERAVQRGGDRLAVAGPDASLTYAALWDGVTGLAETLAARTGPQDLVGVLLPAGPMFPLAILACLAAGRPFLALDPDHPPGWIAETLADARPALIIAGEAAPAGVPASQVLQLDRPPPPARPGWRPTPLGPDAPACVLFTSGSTGRPKGVVNSQRGLLQRVAQSINAGHINAEDRLLTLAAPATIVGVRDVLTALAAGAAVRLADPQRLGARRILGLLDEDGASILFAFPALLRSVLSQGGPKAPETLRLVRLGGDTTLWSDIDLIRAWLAPDAKVQLVYAATEAPMMQWFVDGAARGEDPRVPIGYPLAGNRLALIDAEGRPVPPGEAGELVAGGPHLALGLWAGGRVVPGAVEGQGACRRLRTGDLARVRSDGLIERLGRLDRQVKIRGLRVELDGVEAALRRHPMVRDVAALARDGAKGGAMLVAHVSPRPGASGSLMEELKALMGDAPPAMRPGRLYLVPEIPRLASSKLDVRALKVLDEAQAASERARAAVPARAVPAGEDPLARTVAGVWFQVLQTPVRGPEDDFFEAGGDSLKAIALMLALEQALGLELPLTLINEAPGFAALCRALDQHRAGRYVPLVLLKPGEGSTALYFIHGAGGAVLDLVPIARAMTWPGPVFGVQARGLDRRAPPHRTVEAMAGAYLAEIRARQPEGPYHLCGYSFGGLVAFEIARQLMASGDRVGLVGLFDTVTSPVRWPLGATLAFLRRRGSDLFGRMRAVPLRAWPASVLKAGGRAGEWLLECPTQAEIDGAGLPSALRSAPPGVLRVAASALMASARYRPGAYPGELTLFVPAGRDPALPTPEEIWRRHAQSLRVAPLDGGHFTMLAAANAATAAAALTARLAELG